MDLSRIAADRANTETARERMPRLELEEAIRTLPTAEILRLRSIAAAILRRRGVHADGKDDLLNQALYQTVQSAVTPVAGTDISAVIITNMKFIAIRLLKFVHAEVSIDDVQDNELRNSVTSADDEIIGQQFEKELLAYFGRDPRLLEALQLRIEGHSWRAIQQGSGLPEDKFNHEVKRKFSRWLASFLATRKGLDHG
jgi:hypothetical protein